MAGETSSRATIAGFEQAGQQLRVSKFCESEMATKDTHLVL
jgi:hypothetical protein